MIGRAHSRGGDWLHLSGITPAISKVAAETTAIAAQSARKIGMTVSCDLNFRKKLWRWQSNMGPNELARQTMRQLLEHVDVVIANEADCHDVLGIQADATDVDAGRLAVDRYPGGRPKVGRAISPYQNGCNHTSRKPFGNAQ